MPVEVRRETQGPFPVATGICGFLSIFKGSQASSPFEALNSMCLSSFQRDVRSPVEMRQGTRSFSRVSTGDSHNPSSCEMQEVCAFKSLQGIPDLFRFRASRCPFHLRPQTQGTSHIHIADEKYPLEMLLESWYPLESKPGNQLSSQVDLGCTEYFCVATVTSEAL